MLKTEIEESLISEEERENRLYEEKLDKLMHSDLTGEQIVDILEWEDKYYAGLFLKEYGGFDEHNLPVVHRYILENLDHPDRMFVSDLIEFAEEFDLDLPYEKCLDLLWWECPPESDENDEHFVVMAVIDYLAQNIKGHYIERIVKGLERIINNRNQYQSTQVHADLLLFRITHKRKYLMDLIDLVVNLDHRKLINNLLKSPCYQQRYFDYHDFLKTICQLPKKDKKK